MSQSDAALSERIPIWGQHVWERWRWNWCFELYARNGKVLRYGQGYARREDAEKAMATARRDYKDA